MSDEEKDAPLDAFHQHEVLHTASIIAQLFEKEVVEHRFTYAHPELRAEAEQICKLLWDFYQHIGRVQRP